MTDLDLLPILPSTAFPDHPSMQRLTTEAAFARRQLAAMKDFDVISLGRCPDDKSPSYMRGAWESASRHVKCFIRIRKDISSGEYFLQRVPVALRKQKKTADGEE